MIETDTAGNPIFRITPCCCGFTGGCNLCMPKFKLIRSKSGVISQDEEEREGLNNFYKQFRKSNI